MARENDKAPEALHGGRYVVRAKLGEGAQATTWDALDTATGASVAIKHFDVRGAKAWKDVELAEREARVLASLSHPRLPRYIEHFEENGALYLVMEKIEGTPLSVLRKRGGMTEADVVRLLREADEMLTYLHGLAPAVIHRDLKPSNVIRRPDGSFAFVDFGAVRDRMRPEGGSTVAGTFGYMAPEQFQGRAGPGSDVYAIGATALAMLTGVEPEALPHRGLSIDVERALAGRASPELQQALARMLEPNPDVRPARIPVPRVAGEASGANQSRPPPAARAPWEHHGDHGDDGPPPAILIVVGLALTLAQLAVILALKVVVPTVLTFLSIVFGKGLRDAARSVSLAGDQASDSVARARAHVGRPHVGASGPRTRVAPQEDTRVRVSQVDAAEEAREEGETEAKGRRRGA